MSYNKYYATYRFSNAMFRINHTG